MTNVKNDGKILELKKKIEKKKKELGNGRFNPITNCNIEWYQNRYNLNVLCEEVLQFLLIELSIRQDKAKELEIDYTISGYPVEDWITDIKSKLAIINSTEEQKKLKVMESKLDKLLSNEKKVELELEEIAEML